MRPWEWGGGSETGGAAEFLTVFPSCLYCAVNSHGQLSSPQRDYTPRPSLLLELSILNVLAANSFYIAHIAAGGHEKDI